MAIEFNPDCLSWQDNYRLMVGSILPRPIAFVSTISRQGIRNLAPFSFFNGVCPKPFIVSFAPMLQTQDGRPKDTAANIQDTKEFVINMVSEDLVEKMNLTSGEYPPDVDEFEVAGLTPVPSIRVAPPRVAESAIQFECVLENLLTFGTEPGGGYLVLGRVVHVHIRDDVYDNGRIRTDVLRPVARMAGNDYLRSRDRFSLLRPRNPGQTR